MKNYLLTMFVITFLASCSGNPMTQYQEDVDLMRLEHLDYWTSILDEYNQIKGYYPFQGEIQNSDDIVLVKIATKKQLQYLSSGGSKYNKKLDNNQTGYFKEHSVREFVTELEAVLNRTIDEKYDIQKEPTSSPVGYYYFTSKDGYLVWVTCMTCGVTHVSTFLLDGFTPTVNIVSEGMIGKVPKALPKQEMLSHPTYKAWVARPFHNEEHARELVSENKHDSKQ